MAAAGAAYTFENLDAVLGTEKSRSMATGTLASA